MKKNEEKPIMVFQKNIDKTRNKIIIPQAYINANGRNCLMEVYDGYLKIKPITIKEISNDEEDN